MYMKHVMNHLKMYRDYINTDQIQINITTFIYLRFVIKYVISRITKIQLRILITPYEAGAMLRYVLSLNYTLPNINHQFYVVTVRIDRRCIHLARRILRRRIRNLIIRSIVSGCGWQHVNSGMINDRRDIREELFESDKT